MRVLSLDTTPHHECLAQMAGRRGRPEVVRVPIVFGKVQGLLGDVDAVILTGDLQGIAPSWSSGGESRLLGEAIVDALAELADADAIPPLHRCGAVLAGDLYSAPGADVRGASGDVTSVWLAFGAACAWVAGVRGNHDDVDIKTMARHPHLHLLDGQTTLDGQVGGLGLVAGDMNRRGRRDPDLQRSHLETLAAITREVIVVHEGPPGMAHGQRGSVAVDDALSTFCGLVVCGHVHWETPLSARPGGGQVLNVDGRVVVLTEAGQKEA